jgi:hypothetical protein
LEERRLEAKIAKTRTTIQLLRQKLEYHVAAMTLLRKTIRRMKRSRTGTN